MSVKHLTTIVCAHNQSDRLENCIRSMLAADVPSGWRSEVLVVDNNSTDNTAEVVKQLAAEQPDSVRYTFERVQGKCYALNRGIRESRGDIILFTDQDCLAPPDWYTTVVRVFDNDPQLGLLGGRVVLHNNKDAEATTRTSTVRRLLNLTDIQPNFIPIVGCNMAIRRSVFERVGLFDTSFGPGTRLPAAEDLDILHRICAAGIKVLYEPDALIYHDHGRTEHSILAKLNRAYAVSRGGYYAKFGLRMDSHTIRAARYEVVSLLERIVRQPFAESSAPQRRHLSALSHGVGIYVLERLRGRGGEVHLGQPERTQRSSATAER